MKNNVEKLIDKIGYRKFIKELLSMELQINDENQLESMLNDFLKNDYPLINEQFLDKKEN
ncbi:hypothetical protein [Enterococcus faecalis]|uniref:hypothetical protein n=1 Tax=Enterococcus faecalis TaxID=1351 RepID=UPI001E43F6F2|nr:hypothetical protein [Enterococcus faecalis]MCD5250579.1 hypothetical protein [Enterococcus faecalis]MCV3154397.1 hypothetical protein [Enterococcus faecalis]MDT2066850.1 hypothetical protein [Enterococcus faecalis]MDT2160983.1 hypothetical protein [Enterococcus faecalis]WCG57157.1 hypothetical protein PML97_13950 [Enterococcus faecalis]